MLDLPLSPEDRGRFAKTVGESDVYLFAGITGDLAGNHVNEEYMKATPFGRRIAQGALIVGFMAAAATDFTDKLLAKNVAATPVALGYDRIRFVKPVFLGDTVTVTYRVLDSDPVRARTRGEVLAVNQHGETVAVATHIIKWLDHSQGRIFGTAVS